MTKLGTLGYLSSWGYAVNDIGQVVGCLSSQMPASLGYSAFLYSNGSMHDLGKLPGGRVSYASGINDAGQVVGYSETADSGTDHAIVYSNGVMEDLNSVLSPTSGWVLTDAVAINDNGQIIGDGSLNGVEEGFLLTPTPLPPSLLLLAPSLIGAGVVKRWAKR